VARGGIAFRISPRPMNALVQQYARDLSARMAVVRRVFVVAAAERAKEVIDDRLPSGDQFDDLKKALVVREVEDLDPMKEAASAVLGTEEDVKKRLRELPLDRTLLVVQQPNPRIQPPPEDIFILRASNPWTVRTIPFVPKANVARTVFRLVTKEEVKRVESARSNELSEVVARLEKIGHRFDGDERKRLKMQAAREEPVEDLAFASIRAEFGVPGFPNAPHWRPAIREVRDALPVDFFKRQDVRKTILDPEFERWKILQKRSLRRTVGTKRVEQLKEFQEKVKPR